MHKLNAQLKKKRNETNISFLIKFLIRDWKGSMQLCLHFLKDFFKYNTQKGCIIHHVCYRPCVSASIAIACISECILSMKYYSKKWCIRMNIKIRPVLVLFSYKNERFLSSSLIITHVIDSAQLCSVEFPRKK